MNVRIQAFDVQRGDPQNLGSITVSRRRDQTDRLSSPTGISTMSVVTRALKKAHNAFNTLRGRQSTERRDTDEDKKRQQEEGWERKSYNPSRCCKKDTMRARSHLVLQSNSSFFNRS